MKKTDLGQFNTRRDVWLKPQVVDFIKTSSHTRGLDPFAGDGDLIMAMFDLGLKPLKAFDIDTSLNWSYNDSLVDIPYFENTIVITNPPYYARVSASRKKSSCLKYFEGNSFADLYQIAIGNVLKKYDEAVFIIPETYFLTENMFFKESLLSITVLEDNPFYDTDCPVCVACFARGDLFEQPSYDIYKNDKFLFTNEELENILRRYAPKMEMLKITFNDPNGNVGLRGVDGVNPNEKIKFCLPEELNYDTDKIKVSSRAITILNVEGDFCTKYLIRNANLYLNNLRKDTEDVIFAPFKGNNKIGKRRRRLDFYWARKILNKVLTNGN
jgi:hypothetical protein